MARRFQLIESAEPPTKLQATPAGMPHLDSHHADDDDRASAAEGASARKKGPELRIGPFRLSSTGVRVEGRPELTEWKGPLEFSLWCQKAGPWWIGDMLNQGESSFGEAFYAMCEGAVSGDQLNRYASVARRVPIRNRRASLSWSAHAAVARLDNPGQRRLLALAEKNGWSSEELRVEARLYQEQAKQKNNRG